LSCLSCAAARLLQANLPRLLADGHPTAAAGCLGRASRIPLWVLVAEDGTGVAWRAAPRWREGFCGPIGKCPGDCARARFISSVGPERNGVFCPSRTSIRSQTHAAAQGIVSQPCPVVPSLASERLGEPDGKPWCKTQQSRCAQKRPRRKWRERVPQGSGAAVRLKLSEVQRVG
jgi:hypothetical protein